MSAKFLSGVSEQPTESPQYICSVYYWFGLAPPQPDILQTAKPIAHWLRARKMKRCGLWKSYC